MRLFRRRQVFAGAQQPPGLSVRARAERPAPAGEPRDPWEIPVFVVTRRPEEEPGTREFNFVGGFDEAMDRTREIAGDKDVAIGRGAHMIRQASMPASSTSSRLSSRR